jgi:ubiquinone/menaquinone biosynthesis C-methylase UbiE
MASERQEHNQDTPWWGEHIHRYQMAGNYISGQGRVLDIACGNGFGTHLLSSLTTDQVTGADISEAVVKECREKFRATPTVDFAVIDGTQMSYPDETFRLITSFETIEHTTAYKAMLSEFYRTLEKGGIALISTPNILVNSPGGTVLNPFHTQEFNLDELSEILNNAFDEVQLFGQEYVRYSKSSMRNSIGLGVENLLYARGIRKLPLSIQNRIMRLLIGKDMYPSPSDYDLRNERDRMLKCKTFFAVCRKKNN